MATTEDEAERLIAEDDVLTQAEMVAFVARTQAAEQQRRVERLASLAELWGFDI